MEDYTKEYGLQPCNDCPRSCGIIRRVNTDGQGTTGVCGMPLLPVLARAAIHNWEEPCISGQRGSGTVFFSGCSLHCCYCQNYKLSTENFGREISIQRLREIYQELLAQGVHNINLVNPTHFVRSIGASLTPRLPVPVVYNSSGYERIESLRLLEGKIAVYLPDLKYSDSTCARELSAADDYFAVTTKAIKEMYRQVGCYEMNAEGILKKGLIIRHLVLPGRLQNTFGVIDWVAANFPPHSILFSLMGQYLPQGRAAAFSELDRCLTSEEYQRAEEYLLASGIEDGFVQELTAASAEYIPTFNLEGILK